MENIKYVAPCLLGIEGLVSNELKFMDAKNVMAENGRVTFEGDFNTLARANIRSRYSERILILLNDFKAFTFEDLFQGVKSIPWEKFISKTDAFPVKGKSLNSKLHSIPACQKIVKKAVVERLKEKHNIPWFEETGPLHQIQFLILKDRVSIMLDTSGDGLHKRGYRAIAQEAPIKETLAAAMVDLSMVRENHTVIDPMCGSGTIIIEAAMKALNIAPGINRSFQSEKWSQIPSKVWKEEREKAKKLENFNCEFQGIALDIDSGSIKLARENAKKAGVESRIKFKNQNINEFKKEFDRGSVITNPPYGERLMDVEKAQELYKVMGEKFIASPGWSYTIISPDQDFEEIFGRVARRRRKLYNGMIECQVYMYF